MTHLSPTRDPWADLEDDGESNLILGRPVEDRTFEVMETGLGFATGMAIGTAVAGPIGTAIGGLVGAVAGLAAGEALERAAGRAATTTNAAETERTD